MSLSWTIEKPIPNFAVPDLDAGIAFYERLGFFVDWRWPTTDPTHAGLMMGECSIMLAKCDPAVKADVYFIVTDVAACHAHIMSTKPWELSSHAGALANRDDCPSPRSLKPPNAPAETGYGLRDFSLEDPWGNHMSFGEPLPEPTRDTT